MTLRFKEEVERQNQSPILRDLVRGNGGYGSGWFDMVGADRLPVSTAIVNNNASATYTVPSSTYYVHFTGTQVGTVAFTFPAASSSIDGSAITIITDAAIGTSATFASSGATFRGPPATLPAGGHTTFKYFHSLLEWRVV